MSINRNKYMPYVFGNGRVVLVENKIIQPLFIESVESVVCLHGFY